MPVPLDHAGRHLVAGRVPPAAYARAKPMRVVLRPALAVLALSLLPLAAVPSSVQRCEGKDGRVTYSNTQCPEGTVPVRKVNTDPPISVEERRAAQEQARKDDAAVKQLERERRQQDARERKQSAEAARAEAKLADRCAQARGALERATATRSELARRGAALEKLQKADQDIGRREAAVAKDCPR